MDMFFGSYAGDLAIDLGTANTLVSVRGKGIVIREPSVVAIDKNDERILAVGIEAKRMLGRTPGNIVAVRPLKDGVIADFDVTEAMLRYFIDKASEKRYPWTPRPRVVVCVPSGVTSVEKRAVFEATIQAGARQAYLIEEPMAAAIGADLPVEEPTGSMVIDIGGGTTEVAVIAMGGIVVSQSIRIAGDEFDQAILTHVRDAYNLAIGERTAEDIKIKVGSAVPLKDELDVEVNGRDVITGLPKTVRIESEEIRRALNKPLDEMAKAVKDALDATPPDLASDLMYYGILLTGGGALLRGLDVRLRDETGVSVNVSPTALDNVVNGCARVLEANGAKVVREYYFNDHGEQINRFAKSLVAAWAEANNLGEAGYQTETPCDGYKGAYINEIAARVQAEAESDGVDLTALAHQDQGLNDDGEPLGEADTEVREEFRKRAVPMMFDEIQKSMKDFRVNFDVWFHENSLYADGKVDAAIEELKSRGDIFDKDGATWFESTKHGDDKDRVIIKSNGEFAYFAADIAYYWDKRHRAENSADVAIYMLGADHHGYIGRMMAMCAAFGDEPGKNMQILIGQLVNVMKDGKPVRMSKRAGNVVTIDDLVSVVGVDAARYSLARSDYNQNFDIDLALLASHTNDNPVYYVQYAHARSKNVDRNAAAAGISYEGADLALLDTEADGEVLAALAQFPSVLATAADDRQPHKVARYLEELAATYHKWYNVERVVPMALTDPETRGDDEARKALEIAKNPEPARAAARLKLNDAVQQVIANGLDLLGVTAPEKM